MFTSFLSTSISGRAVSGGLISVNVINLRLFGTGNYKQLDDYAFGSGGMLFAAPQLKSALDSAKINNTNSFVVYPSPQGALITQEMIQTLFHQEHVIIICGHYEGIDERFTQKYVDLELSIGDCVLTGGEIPAMLIIDAMSRLVPGVVGKSNAVIEDSFYRGMLDNPNYTRPAQWENMNVPEVLLSGNAGKISRWRRKNSIERTIARRPDLLSRASIREYLVDGLKTAFILHKDNECADFSGVPELCMAYETGRPFVISRSKNIRDNAKKMFPQAKILGNISDIYEENMLVIKIFASSRENSMNSLDIKRKCLEHNGKILLIFSDDDNELEGLEGINGYLYEEKIDVPLNVKTGIAFDKFFGKR